MSEYRGFPPLASTKRVIATEQERFHVSIQVQLVIPHLDAPPHEKIDLLRPYPNLFRNPGMFNDRSMNNFDVFIHKN